MIGYGGYLAIIAGIAYDKLKAKSADGVQVEDITTSVAEATQIFDDFLKVIAGVIDNKNVNDKDTILVIKEAIKIVNGQ